MPKFSVVIPTRARPDTLAHSLSTVVEQRYEDVEIIVHESGDDPRTAETVAAIGDHRTRHLKTGQPVSMTENWERALNAAAGEYVTFIGDDDGLTSDACDVASSILAARPTELLSWRPIAYYWPQYVLEQQRNRLQGVINTSNVLELKSSRLILDLFYRFREDYSRLPMIYNSFISRALVDRVRANVGRYFLGAAPDISSGIVNAFFSDVYLLSGRPLSAAGLSHHSTGHRLYFSPDRAHRPAAEAAAFDGLNIHPTLVHSRNLKLFIGNEMLVVKERVFPREEPAFDYRNLIYSTLQSLESVPGNSEATLADITEIASRNGVAIDDFTIPPHPDAAAPAAQGVRPIGEHSILLDIDCAATGVANVADALRLLQSLLAPAGNQTIVNENPVLRSLPVEPPAPLRVGFSQPGNGALFLGFGWGDREPWGTWTTGRCAEIRMRLDGQLNRPIKIGIEGQMFVHPGMPDACGRVRLNRGCPIDFRASLQQPNINIQMVVTPEEILDDALVLEFEIDRPISPAELGISPDTRRLGFGLKHITVEA